MELPWEWQEQQRRLAGLGRGNKEVVAGGREKNVFNRQAGKRRVERGLYVFPQQTIPFLGNKNEQLSAHPKHGNITLSVLHGKVSKQQF